MSQTGSEEPLAKGATDKGDDAAGSSAPIAPSKPSTGASWKSQLSKYAHIPAIMATAFGVFKLQPILYDTCGSGSWISDNWVCGKFVNPSILPAGSIQYPFEGHSVDIKGLGGTSVGISWSGEPVVQPGSDGKADFCVLVHGDEGEESTLFRVSTKYTEETRHVWDREHSADPRKKSVIVFRVPDETVEKAATYLTYMEQEVGEAETLKSSDLCTSDTIPESKVVPEIEGHQGL